MKKLSLIILALLVTLGGVAQADVQIDSGQKKSQAAKKFFIGRYARTGAITTAGGFEISKDSVVIWDTASDDGVTITTTSTSGDALVAGVALDTIPGSSRDYNAVSDDNYNNWGRIQCWGLYSGVSYDNNQQDGITAGMRVAAGGSAQTSTIYREVSLDATANNYPTASQDSFGVSLDAPTGNTLDVHIERC